MEFYEKYGYKLSQTSLKDLEKDSTCPVRWKEQWLLKGVKFVPSLPMIQGLYFEQEVIGEHGRVNHDTDKNQAGRIDSQDRAGEIAGHDQSHNDHEDRHDGNVELARRAPQEIVELFGGDGSYGERDPT